MCDKYYGYLGPGDDNKTFTIKKGQVIAGYPIGILLLDVWYPLMPGNVVNASTYNFPVRHKLVKGATQKRMHTGDPTLITELIEAGKELEMEGVRAIVGACGYFGHFQPQLAEALNVPVYASSLVQIPWIKIGLKPNEKIAVLCADEKNLNSEILKKCGVDDPSICIIEGLGDRPEFSAILNSDRGKFDNKKVRQEVVTAAENLVKNNRNIGAILLECSDMPPYAADVQRAVNLPVFDFITMIKWVYNSVAQKPYYGFL
jgi:hypothetical protein